MAARAQKWIDQSISRNMYLETRDLGDMMDIYYAAWERGVKTTYYLHMKPRHTAEQSTVKVNKSEDIVASASASAPASTEGAAPAAAPTARRGFGGLGKMNSVSEISGNEGTVYEVPVDPMDDLQCESCQ